jgi:flagellar motor switch protein FliG
MKKASLSGPQKAAALLLTIDPEAAASVLATLPDESIAAVGRAMVEFDPGDLDRDKVAELQEEFLSGVREGASIPPGLSELLDRTVGPERARKMLSRIEESVKRDRPFAELERLEDPRILRCLRDEHPQVVALVCSKIPAERAAKVLGGLAEDQRVDIVSRMASMQPIPRDLLDDVATALAVKAKSQESLPVEDPALRFRSVAQVLNAAEVSVEQEILAGLEEKDADLAQRIRERMFVFEDLARLDKRGMQKVLSSIDARVLALALKAADPEIVENFFANMTKRVKETVAEERELLGGVPLSDVLKAQDEIVTAVRGLVEKGEIKPSRGGAADLVE